MLRFELAIAAKYLIPSSKQLSVSIISLLSLLVISLVIWLILVFLSVTNGLEKSWIDKLVAVSAPVRATPTEAYWNSYYHNIDQISAASRYKTRSIEEKLHAASSHPYNSQIDQEIPRSFPLPLLDHQGQLRDIVKESAAIFNNEAAHLIAEPYELSLAQLTFSEGHYPQTTYFATLPVNSPSFPKSCTKNNVEEINALLHYIFTLGEPELLEAFFTHCEIKSLIITAKEGYLVPEEFRSNKNALPLTLPEGTVLRASLDKESLKEAKTISDLVFFISLYHQKDEEIKGRLSLIPAFELNEATIEERFEENPAPSPLWFYLENRRARLPSHPLLGEPLLVAKQYKENGVHLGSQGTILFHKVTASGMRPQETPFYVAGFYDPGITPIGSKLVMASSSLLKQLRQSQPLSTGFLVWLDDFNKAKEVKERIISQLKREGLADYWLVESYHDYDFAKDLIEQLQSDKMLFSLMAIIIIIVACSNIVSMLILLVNDKRKEIGILQSMGASSKSIALIFGCCALFLGIASATIGSVAAFWTLNNINIIVQFLSYLQGHSAFNQLFFGDSLPGEMSTEALVMVWIATIIISLIAALVPAIKAASMKPTEILRAE